MGLKLWKHNQDRQTAEDHIIVFSSRVWQKSDPFLFEPYQKKIVPINRKPVERRGRKAMDLKPLSHGHDRQAAENELSGF